MPKIIDTKQYALVYQIIAETAKKYYRHKDMAMLQVGNLIADLKASGNEAYKKSKEFPFEFYGRMADTLVRWFCERFSDPTYELASMSLDTIVAELHKLWAFQKEYLAQEDWSKEAFDEMMDAANELFHHSYKRVIDMLGAVIDTFEVQAKSQQATRAETQAKPQPETKQATETTNEPSKE